MPDDRTKIAQDRTQPGTTDTGSDARTAPPVVSVPPDADAARAEPSLTARVVKGAGWVFLGNVAGRGLHLVKLIVLARLLAPEDFGLFGIVMLALVALVAFTQTGFDTALIQRQENTDDYLDTAWTVQLVRGVFLAGALFAAIREIARDLAVVFPVHPRTRKNMERFGLAAADGACAVAGVRIVEPMGYLEFLRLTAEARLVLTDSGGIQEETTILKVLCLTLRENTERPVTVDVGCNQVVGTDPSRILAAYRKVTATERFECSTPGKWDGRAAERIADVLVVALAGRR